MEEENKESKNLMRDRFRLATVSIAESEARKNDMDVLEHVAVCVADLAFKYAEHIAKDVQSFAWHARRKTVKMDDVIISTHRNENLSASLRSFSNNLIVKVPARSERKRRRPSRIVDDDEYTPSVDLQDQDEQISS